MDGSDWPRYSHRGLSIRQRRNATGSRAYGKECNPRLRSGTRTPRIQVFTGAERSRRASPYRGLEEAAAAVSRRYKVRMFSVSGPVLWEFMRGRYANRLEAILGRPFTAVEREALSGDTHAGMWETSLVLMSRPNW